MRTTLSIDDDVLAAARELAQRQGTTVGKVVSELARHGLAASARKRKSHSALRAGVPVLRSRGEIITLEHVQRLRDQEGV